MNKIIEIRPDQLLREVSQHRMASKQKPLELVDRGFDVSVDVLTRLQYSHPSPMFFYNTIRRTRREREKLCPGLVYVEDIVNDLRAKHSYRKLLFISIESVVLRITTHDVNFALLYSVI